MRNMHIRKITILVMFGIVWATPMVMAQQRAIVLSDISDEPVKKIKRLQPLADYLAARLHDFGISTGEVKIAKDLETLSTWMTSGEVDLYFDSLYPAMRICDASGAIPILRRWKSNVAVYHSVFFTRTDSGLTSIDDLYGKMVAFEEPFSTSGYMLPLAYLVQQGHKPAEKARLSDTVAAHEIGYIFSGDDQNAIRWVLSRKVAAAVLDDENFLDIPEKTRNGLTILARTESVPRQVVVVRPKMEPTMLEAIKTLLTELDESAEGRDVLKKLKKTAQFDEFPEGADAALAQIRDMYNAVKSSSQ
jgi:phosphonate transport system substrate-binding protein